MRILAFRRPELLLFAALMVFALVVGLRSLRNTPAPVASEQRAAAPAPQTLSSEQTINTLKAQVRNNPDDTAAYAQLGLALLQRVRETADVGLYAQAGQALDAAIKRDPKNIDALVGQGTLALSRHQFADALAWGEKARAVNPYRAAIYGVIGDAYTELGRYDEAATAIDKMVQDAPRPQLVQPRGLPARAAWRCRRRSRSAEASNQCRRPGDREHRLDKGTTGQSCFWRRQSCRGRTDLCRCAGQQPRERLCRRRAGTRARRAW